MSTSSAALNFDSSLPRPYSDSWREAYGQTEDTHRFSSYQAPEGKPVVFAYDSISLSGGQNVDTAEYPHGFWSNKQLGEKTQTITIKGHVIGSSYIAQRNKLAEALRIATDDDNPGWLELPLWGRFKVVVKKWNIDEEQSKTGMSEFSIELVRAGYSDTKRFDEAAKSFVALNVDGAAETLKNTAASVFETAVEKSKDIDTLASGFGKMTKELASIIGRVQGARSIMNDMTNKVNSVMNLIAQGIRAPKELAQAFVSAVFGIASGILEIKNAIDETASYFATDDDDTSTSSGSSDSDDSDSNTNPAEQFIKRNEKNALMQFLSAATYTIDEDAITEMQHNTKTALENLYRVASFGVCALLLTRLDASTETYESQQGLWSLFQKLEESLSLEDSDIYAAVDECRAACAQTLLSFSYDVELTREIRQAMPLLALAEYLGCDAERIRTLNAVADSFRIKGSVIYV